MFFRLKIQIAIIFLGTISLVGMCHATQWRGPDIVVMTGYMQSSEDLYGEFVENSLQTSLIAPIFRWKWGSISSGISYLNSHQDIQGYEYNLTQLIIPLRITPRIVIGRSFAFYAGVQAGFSLLLETFEKTETYSGIGYGSLMGIEYLASPHYSILMEYSNFKATYYRIDNLDTATHIVTIGMGYKF